MRVLKRPTPARDTRSSRRCLAPVAPQGETRNVQLYLAKDPTARSFVSVGSCFAVVGLRPSADAVADAGRSCVLKFAGGYSERDMFIDAAHRDYTPNPIELSVGGKVPIQEAPTTVEGWKAAHEAAQLPTYSVAQLKAWVSQRLEAKHLACDAAGFKAFAAVNALDVPESFTKWQKRHWVVTIVRVIEDDELLA